MVKREIRTQRDVDPNFLKEVLAEPGGEGVLSCIQCGTCSGTCPMSIYMDLTPRQVMAMVREGLRDDVLGSLTIWLCSSCYACTVRCPQEIKITDVMYALKRIAIRSGVGKKNFPSRVMNEEFYKLVKSNGRNSEFWLTLRMYTRTGIFKALGMSGLGLSLMSKGRMPLSTERIKGAKELSAALSAVERGGEG